MYGILRRRSNMFTFTGMLAADHVHISFWLFSGSSVGKKAGSPSAVRLTSSQLWLAQSALQYITQIITPSWIDLWSFSIVLLESGCSSFSFLKIFVSHLALEEGENNLTEADAQRIFCFHNMNLGQIDDKQKALLGKV